jgi:flagellar basal-body rod protein FlgB
VAGRREFAAGVVAQFLRCGRNSCRETAKVIFANYRGNKDLGFGTRIAYISTTDSRKNRERDEGKRMLINGLLKNTGTEALDRVVQFTESRHQVLANNLANLDTPDYKMQDLDVTSFQQDLKKAVETRSFESDSGDAAMSPKPDYQQYLLFHDGNNRSMEKQVSQMTKNTMMHNVAIELLRNRYNMLDKAISLRP